MVVNILKKKSTFVSLALGILLALLFFKLQIKYFIFASGGLITTLLAMYNVNIGIGIGIVILPFIPDELSLVYLIFIALIYTLNLMYKKDYYLDKSFIHMPIIFYLALITISTLLPVI